MKKTYLKPSTEMVITGTASMICGSRSITSNNEEIIYGGIDENGVLDPASRLRNPNIWGDEEEDDF